MTTDEWVRKLNRLAAEMDRDCEGVHPSAWAELTKDKREKWHRLAERKTDDSRRLH